ASRRGPRAPGAEELVQELAKLGAQASVVECDIADRAQLEALLESIPEECPLRAVFHAAGVIDDGLVDALDLERVGAVLAPKAAAWHLHELTADLPLQAFVLFSSSAGTLGSGGQGSYAAGNAFLDALAEHRRARGLVATSVAWGAWAQAGMAAQVSEHLRRQGVRLMDPRLALAALGRELARDETRVLLADIDWERYAEDLVAAGRPLVDELVTAHGQQRT